MGVSRYDSGQRSSPPPAHPLNTQAQSSQSRCEITIHHIKDFSSRHQATIDRVQKHPDPMYTAHTQLTKPCPSCAGSVESRDRRLTARSLSTRSPTARSPTARWRRAQVDAVRRSTARSLTARDDSSQLEGPARRRRKTRPISGRARWRGVDRQK